MCPKKIVKLLHLKIECCPKFIKDNVKRNSLNLKNNNKNNTIPPTIQKKRLHITHEASMAQQSVD